ncbi:hypothetical protein NZD86_01025 [Alicyclobacillus dauci]|uniref:Uncharacterized protein n=1 Tax=Alicyclobacillus dauci TaxID=1475485 RepID=A0ABY6Z4P2_9BACL|nr:hypothetical protein [Alicyclobacillus dauci]WAH37166.1 hypothetical protein NZD86_01025 [Alicyclobacillus dauci]
MAHEESIVVAKRLHAFGRAFQKKHVPRLQYNLRQALRDGITISPQCQHSHSELASEVQLLQGSACKMRTVPNNCFTNEPHRHILNALVDLSLYGEVICIVDFEQVILMRFNEQYVTTFQHGIGVRKVNRMIP